MKLYAYIVTIAHAWILPELGRLTAPAILCLEALCKNNIMNSKTPHYLLPLQLVTWYQITAAGKTGVLSCHKCCPLVLHIWHSPLNHA